MSIHTSYKGGTESDLLTPIEQVLWFAMVKIPNFWGAWSSLNKKRINTIMSVVYLGKLHHPE
jgi:hypothetical protein